MSTKIYDAYKVLGGFDVVEKIRKEMYVKVAKYIKDETEGITRTLGEISEEVDFGRNKDMQIQSFGNAFSFELVDIEELLSSRGGYLHSLLNHKMVVYFLDGSFYIQIFSRCKIKDLIEKGYMIDYHYQDQCDPWWVYEVDKTPDKYTEKQISEFEKEYEERGKVWDKIIDDNLAIPVACGYIHNLLYGVDYK